MSDISKIKFLFLGLILCSIILSGTISYAAELTRSWDPPTTNADGTLLTDLGGYVVYYGTESGNYTQSIDVGNVTTYTVTNLLPGTTYFFAITAYDTVGNESGYSDEVVETTPDSDTTPPIISAVQATNITSISAVISWVTDEAADTQIEYGTSTSYGHTTTLDSSMVTNHSQTLSFTSSSGDITLLWDAPTTNSDGTPLTDLDGYNIHYGTESGNYPYNINVGNVTTYQISGLTVGTTYYFRVTAYDTSGNESEFSNEVIETIQPSYTMPPGTEINYRARSRDSSGNLAVSGNYTFILSDTGSVNYYCDNDNDGYISSSINGSCTGSGCEPVGCQLSAGNDCNDSNANINPTASDSDCNGLDENCDGTPDNGYVSTNTACGLGVCASTGQLVCSNGSVVDTCSAGSPTGNDSDCNGLDENCDGTPDNNYIPTDTICGQGTCESNGQLICSNGSLTDTCIIDAQCVPYNEPTANINGPYTGVEGEEILLDASASCNIDPNGTYIDAENFTGTINQGSYSFSVDTVEGGYLGSGYLISHEGTVFTGTCPPAHEGKEYTVNFPVTGIYNIWKRGYALNNGSDSIFIGLDGNCVGALSEDAFNQWEWSNSIQNGINTINVTTAGTHTINIWVRESDHKLDGIYLDTVGATPTDASHGIEINPTSCSSGNIVLYEWDIDNDGTYDYSSSSETQSHIYDHDGTYMIKLRVTDDIGASDEATTTASISDTSPTASFIASSTTGTAPHGVGFINQSTGYDQDLTYEWDFNDDGTIDSTSQNPFHTYSVQGTYTVTLHVTDSDGSIDTLTRSDYVTVQQDPTSLSYYCDTDNDGYISSSINGSCAGSGCEPAGCQTTPGNDCNDANASFNPAASDANCNSLDENCDGTPDNNYIPANTNCGQGVCASTGQLVCSNGSIIDTCSAGSPTGDDSNCNGLDENCDGTPDSNYVTLITSCGSGICSSAGQLECQNGTEVNTCSPGSPSEVTESSCDGLDNDCDGFTDEECSPVIEISKVLINEDFADGMPQTWSVQGSWNASNACGKSIDYPFVEPYAIVDSSCTNTGVDELTTETLDTTSCSNVSLTFSNQYYWYAGNMEIETSHDGGTTWTSALYMNYNDGYPSSNWKDLDISTVSDSEQALVKFKYSNSDADGFWALDNVWVTCRSSQLDFSAQTQETSAPQTIVIANSGSEALTVNTITIEGANASEFSMSGSENCANQILQPAESCTFDIMFSPTSAGTKNATFSISSTDPNSPLSSISLAGSAYDPVIITPSALLKINNSQSKNVTINRGSNLSLSIELDGGSLEGYNADWWLIIENNNRPYYYDSSNGKWRRGLHPYQQGSIYNLSPAQVPNSPKLRHGQYIFKFGVDMEMNGIMDDSRFYHDEVILNVE